jgi:hypothetical protein
MDTKKFGTPLIGNLFMKKLVEAGISEHGSSRTIIDIRANGVVQIYNCKFADEQDAEILFEVIEAVVKAPNV